MELGINLVTPACYRDATDSGGSCVMVGSMALIDEIFKGNLAAGLVMDVGAPRSMTDAKNRPSHPSEGLRDMTSDKSVRSCDPQSFHHRIFP